jgi:hypothetical protein
MPSIFKVDHLDRWWWSIWRHRWLYGSFTWHHKLKVHWNPFKPLEWSKMNRTHAVVKP